MKHAAILLVLGTFLLVMGIYILTNVMPMNEEKLIAYSKTQGFLTDNEVINSVNELIERGLIFRMIETKSIIVFLLIFTGMIVSYFSALHLIIDKLFFKKFYQSPNVVAAYRRGIFLSLILIGLLFLRLINSLLWYNAMAIILLGLLLELFITGILKERALKKDSSHY